MSKNILIICEGKAEYSLTEKIITKEIKNVEKLAEIEIEKMDQGEELKYIVGDKNVYLYDLGGETKLRGYIDVFLKNRLSDDINKMIFLMDADNSKGEVSGFQRTKASLDDIIKLISLKSKEIECSFYILPNNQNDGMIEDLCLSSLKCSSIVDYILSTTIPTVKEFKECNITNNSKSAFMMVAATQNPLKAFSHHMISDCYKFFNPLEGDLKKLIDYIKNEI